MKKTVQLTGKALLTSLLLAGGLSNIANAASGVDETYKNVTLEERLYLFDGYGSKWGFDAGSDGLWIVPERPIGDTYDAPLKIRNSAEANTLVIGTNDENNITNSYVGIGTDNPTAKFSVVHEGAGTEAVYSLIKLTANDTDGTGPSEAAFVLENAKFNKQWLFRTIDNGSSFTATLGGTGGAEFKVSSPTGAATGTNLYLGSGASCVNGVWTNRSSRASKENIHPLTSEVALEAFHKLQPMTYNYKSDKAEQYVGFIAEDVPDLVAINSRDGLSAMDMVAVLTKVVQEQEKKIQNLEAMQRRLAKVESLLTNLALDTSKANKEKVTLNK